MVLNMCIIRLYLPMDSPRTLKTKGILQLKKHTVHIWSIEHTHVHKNIYLINIDMCIYKKRQRFLKEEIPQE